MNTQPTAPCVRHPQAPVIGGICGGCTVVPSERAVPLLAEVQPAVSGVSSEEAAANVTAAVPVLAAVGLPAAEACTSPYHTGPIRAHLGCTGPDPAETVEHPTDGAQAAEDAARRFARRLRAVELLCAGRPGYHAITVKALLTAMGEADEEGQEPPLLDPFTEAAVRRGALLGGADAIEALPQDHECDPGRGDAVKLLRRLAGLTTTTEQPTGLTWQARAEHAVRLYATTAIELEDARRENGRLRDRLAELEQHQADALDAKHPDSVESLLADLADDLEPLLPHDSARAYAVAGLARHTRLLADEARERLAERDAEMRADGYRGRVAWCSGMREVVKLLADRADALAPCLLYLSLIHI